MESGSKKIYELYKADNSAPVHYYTKIYFYFEDQYQQADCFLCEDCLVIKTSSVDKEHIYYSNIRKCVLDEQSYFLFKLSLFNEIFNNQSHIYLACSDRELFRHKLEICFRAYYLDNFLRDNKMPIFKGVLHKKLSKMVPQDYFKIPKVLDFSESKYSKIERGGYSFLLPILYKAMPGCNQLIFFRGDQDEIMNTSNDFFSFQISRDIPMNQFEFFGSRRNLAFYAEEIMHTWLLGTNSKIDIIEHKSYQKRMNLNGDRARWNSYLISLQEDSSYMYFIGVLRRQFIPPDLEVFDDFVMMMKFDLHGQQNINFSTVNEEEIPSENKSSNPKQIFTVAMDSLMSESIESEVFKDQLCDKIEWLGLSFEEYQFYEYNYGIKPTSIRPISNRIVYYVLRKLNDEYSETKNDNIYSGLIDELNKREKDDTLTNFSSQAGHVLILQIVKNIIEIIPKKVSPKTYEKIKKNWLLKCIDYIFYAIHGGYFPSQLTMFDLIYLSTERLAGEEKPTDSILTFLLRLQPENESFSEYLEDLTKNGASLAPKIIYFLDNFRKTKFTWNKNVLMLYLRNNYILTIMSYDLDRYVELLYSMLTLEYIDSEIRIATLHGVLKLLADQNQAFVALKDDLMKVFDRKKIFVIELLRVIGSTNQNIEYLDAALEVLQLLSLECQKLRVYFVTQGNIQGIIKGLLSRNLRYMGIKESCLLLINSLIRMEENIREIADCLGNEIVIMFKEVVSGKNEESRITMFHLLLQLSKALVRDSAFYDLLAEQGVLTIITNPTYYKDLKDLIKFTLRIEIIDLIYQCFKEKNDAPPTTIDKETTDFVLATLEHLYMIKSYKNNEKLIMRIFKLMKYFIQIRSFRKALSTETVKGVLTELISNGKEKTVKGATGFKSKLHF